MKAIPRIPSNLAAKKEIPLKVVASMKSNPLAVNPSTVTSSLEVIPLMAPLP